MQFPTVIAVTKFYHEWAAVKPNNERLKRRGLFLAAGGHAAARGTGPEAMQYGNRRDSQSTRLLCVANRYHAPRAPSP
jgi:hypothetical protein